MTGPDRRTGQTDRRRQARYPLRLKGTAWCLTGVAAPPFAVETSDVSLLGMMLHTSAPAVGDLAAGDELLLGFDVDGEKAQVTLKGKVSWKRRGLMSLLGAWSFGVEFHGTPEEEVGLLLGPVERRARPLSEA